MFSDSTTGSWAELQLPCYPCKQGELSENMFQTLLLKLPPQTVQLILRPTTTEYGGGIFSEVLWFLYYNGCVGVQRLSAAVQIQNPQSSVTVCKSLRFDSNMLLVRQVIILVSTVCVQTSMSYHVLFYHHWGTKSHIIQFAPVLEELLGRGHEVTAVIFNSIKLKNENYTEILVPNAGEKIISKISEATMSQNGLTLTQLKSMFEAGKNSLEDIAVQGI